MVKTCCGGSSVGVYRVNDASELEKALDEAFTFEDQAIIERCIIGREFSIAVIEGEALPIIEIAPISGFYDYKNKYQPAAPSRPARRNFRKRPLSACSVTQKQPVLP